MIEYKTVSLADQVHETIENKILCGDYAKGEIISETRLAEELGVSRTPIREAMARLTHDMLIKESPNGTVVVGVSEKDINDFLEVKRRLEVLATRWAAENITEDGLKELKDILEQQEFYASKDDAEKVRDLDTKFHDVIYKECGSQVLYGILSPLHHKMMRYRKLSLERKNRIMDSVGEHKAIYDAIATGDKDKVDNLMLIHIEHAYNNMKEGNL